MPIKGINKKVLGRQEIFIFKGARKGTKSAGRDLQNKFRIATENPIVKRILATYYGAPDDSGDFFADSIDFYFCFDLPEQNFDCSMRAYNAASNLLVLCDRDRISKKRTTFTDSKGQVFANLQEVDEPCPIADVENLSYPCPHQCTKHGELVFYLRCVMDASYMFPARLVVHGYEDIFYLNTRLSELFETYGSICNSPFPSFKTKHKIPFNLSRVKLSIRRPDMKSSDEGYLRTGKSCKGFTYPVSLNVIDADWLTQFEQWKKLEQLQTMANISLPPGAIAALINGRTDVMDCIDVTYSQVNSSTPAIAERNIAPALSEAPSVEEPETQSVVVEVEKSVVVEVEKKIEEPSTINEEEWKKLFSLFKENKWTVPILSFLLKQEFGCSKASEILRAKVPVLAAIANDPTELESWTKEFNQACKIQNDNDEKTSI